MPTRHERRVGALTAVSYVIEPCAGDGALLREIPAEINAYGVELDPAPAAQARATSGRQVLCGDVLEIALPIAPAHAISNPPFRVEFINRFLDRFHRIAIAGGTVTFLLPAFMLQTSGRTARYLDRFSITAEIIPRDVFPGFTLPLTVVTFRKDYERRLVGLALVDETNEWRKMPSDFHTILHRSRSNVWVAACERALQILGRPATVEEIRNVVSGHRPTKTPHWEAAIRKALQQNLPKVARGIYRHPSLAAA